MMALWYVSWQPKSEPGSILALISFKSRSQHPRLPHLRPDVNVSLSLFSIIFLAGASYVVP